MNACLHAIAQFSAEKKSRNAANSECASHTISRNAERGKVGLRRLTAVAFLKGFLMDLDAVKDVG